MRRTDVVLLGARRNFSTAARDTLRLPVLRLPTVVFPGQPFSFSACRTPDERPSASLTASQADEVLNMYGGKLVAVADGRHVGVTMSIVGGKPSPSSPPTPKGVLHAVGRGRVLVQQMCGQTDCHQRLADWAVMQDDQLAAEEQQKLTQEANVAQQCLANAAGQIEMQPSVYEEELGLDVCNPRAHPYFQSYQKPPADAVLLSFWLGAHLPLTTSLRAHLLACQCPLKRMQDCVDVLRLLSETDSYRSSRFHSSWQEERCDKFEVVYDTAEVSILGCVHQSAYVGAPGSLSM